MTATAAAAGYACRKRSSLEVVHVLITPAKIEK